MQVKLSSKAFSNYQGRNLIALGEYTLNDNGTEISRIDLEKGEEIKLSLVRKVFNLLVTLSAFIAGLIGFIGFMAGAWLIGIGIMFAASLGYVILHKSNHETIVNEKIHTIKTIKPIDDNKMIHKGAVGTLGGAAAGGVLFGGAGAVVGALASGNKKILNFSTFGIEFEDGEWVVAEFDNETMPMLYKMLSNIEVEKPF